MQKIPSLFKRDYDGDRLVYDEVVPGCEWVLAGEGHPTVKFDGTPCRVQDGRLFKRYDRKLTKSANRRRKRGAKGPWTLSDMKPAPPDWEACEPEPNMMTGHWPGWVPVNPDDPSNRHFTTHVIEAGLGSLPDGTYELVGQGVQGNLYDLTYTVLVRHGSHNFYRNPRTFEDIKAALKASPLDEGIVWHHPDGRMCKIKRRDFGLPWPDKS